MSDVLVLAPIHPDALQLIRDSGLGLTEAQGQPYDQVVNLMPGHMAILTRAGVKIDENLLAHADKLKVVAVGSVGMDSLDLPYLFSKGMKVFNAAGGNSAAVAELAISNMISLLRNVHTANIDMHQGVWQSMFERPQGNELLGKTVGIVGLGNIGSRLARILLAFEANVVAYDPYVRYVWNPSLHENPEVKMLASLDDLLREADIVTVHTPLTEETFHMFSSPQFALMKPSAFFMNLARGKVVDEPALAEALRSKRIAGAAIDVYEKEPANDSPLLELGNVILTPHIAGVPDEARRRMGMVVAQRIIDEVKAQKARA
ncbi:MAG: hydroxyacid dehydrogenase [Chloroflexota bacterium]